MWNADGRYTPSQYEVDKERKERIERDKMMNESLRYLKSLIIAHQLILLDIPRMSRKAYFVRDPNTAKIYEFDPSTRKFTEIRTYLDEFVSVQDVDGSLGI